MTLATLSALAGDLTRVALGQADEAAAAAETAEPFLRVQNTSTMSGAYYVENAIYWSVDQIYGLFGADFVVPESGTWWGAAGAIFAVCLAVFGFINVFGLVAIWVERKTAGHMQCRLGPMEVGPHGLLQTMADGVKLMLKEDIIPRLADKPLFILAPIIVFAGTFIRYVPLPFGDKLVTVDLNVGLFYIAAVGSVEVLGVIMAGWASNNKWSLFATIRTATQMVSYEIPIGLAFVAVAVSAGSLSLQEIVQQQEGWFVNWFCFRNPFLTVLSVSLFVATLAECKRAPFDLPEAESELVSGFHTEYTGMRFAMFFLAEYAAMYLVSAVAVVGFFGGWHTGIPMLDEIGGPVGYLLSAAVLTGKAFLLVFIQIWIRWTLPRVRLDQMMYLCWKVLLPISLLCLVGSAFWDLCMGAFGSGEYSLFFFPR